MGDLLRLRIKGGLRACPLPQCKIAQGALFAIEAGIKIYQNRQAILEQARNFGERFAEASENFTDGLGNRDFGNAPVGFREVPQAEAQPQTVNPSESPHPTPQEEPEEEQPPKQPPRTPLLPKPPVAPQHQPNQPEQDAPFFPDDDHFFCQQEDPDGPSTNSEPNKPGPKKPPTPNVPEREEPRAEGSDPKSSGDPAPDPSDVNPSTPVGRKGDHLQVPPPANKRTIIEGREYSGHAQDRMQEQGIPPSVVEDTIQNGQRFPGRDGADRFYNPSNNTTVLVDRASGRVITVDFGNFGN